MDYFIFIFIGRTNDGNGLEDLGKAKVCLIKELEEGLGKAKVRLGKRLVGLGKAKVRLGKGLEGLGKANVHE